jgi:hypothetical protein
LKTVFPIIGKRLFILKAGLNLAFTCPLLAIFQYALGLLSSKNPHVFSGLFLLHNKYYVKQYAPKQKNPLLPSGLLW